MHLNTLTRVAATIALMTASAWAGDVTYVYTGANYDVFTQGSEFSAEEHLSLSLTLASALLPSTQNGYNIKLISWSAFDGIYSQSSGDSANPSSFLTLSLTTDANDTIVNWNLLFGSNTVRQDGVVLSDQSCNVVIPDQCENNLTYPAFDDDTVIRDGKAYSAATTSPGTWSVFDTPEPGPFPLVTIGMVLALWSRRRTVNSPKSITQPR